MHLTALNPPARALMLQVSHPFPGNIDKNSFCFNVGTIHTWIPKWYRIPTTLRWYLNKIHGLPQDLANMCKHKINKT